MGIAKLPQSGGPATEELVKQADLLAIGMPEYLAKWILAQQANPGGHADVERAARFVEHWRRDTDDTRILEEAWACVSKAAVGDHALVALFGRLPDRPTPDPKAWLIGTTAIDAGERRQRNRKAQRHIGALAKFIEMASLDSLADDALETSQQAHAAYKNFIAAHGGLVAGLNALDRVLGLTNPKARLLGSQFASRGLEMQNYRRLIADLNRFLRTPQHSALSAIANINCPAHPVRANSIARVWNRIAKDNPLDF